MSEYIFKYCTSNSFSASVFVSSKVWASDSLVVQCNLKTTKKWSKLICLCLVIPALTAACILNIFLVLRKRHLHGSAGKNLVCTCGRLQFRTPLVKHPLIREGCTQYSGLENSHGLQKFRVTGCTQPETATDI